MLKAHTAALALSACLLTLAADAATWRVATTQTLVPAPWTFLDVEACNTATGDTSACAGYDEIGVGTSIDRSQSRPGGWLTQGAADLSLGEVAIAGGGPFPYDRALSSAGLRDLLTFSIPGLLPHEEADIGFRLVFDGSFADGSKVGMIFYAGNISGSAEWRGTFFGNTATPLAGDSFTLAGAPDFYNDTVYDPRWTTTGQTVFDGTVSIRGSAPSLPISLIVYGNGAFDLSNTGRLRLVLPPGASFSSESGVFLAAVPEPATVWMMALGGLAMAVMAWRRRRWERAAAG
jgi:hypothetical protein